MTRWRDLNPSNRRYYLWMGLAQVTCALFGLFFAVFLILNLIHWAMG
jgi:hypothetical protein